MREFWRRDTALWVFAAAAVALNALVGSYNVRRMEGSERVLRTTRSTLADLSALLNDLTDAETGHRGYLLVGRIEYLEPFAAADARVWGRLAALRERLAGETGQAERLAAVERLAREKFAEMRRTIAIRAAVAALQWPYGFPDAAAREVAAAAVADGNGKRVMDTFRATVREVVDVEEGRLAARSDSADAQYRTADFTTLLGAVLAIGVLAGVAVLSRRESARRVRLAARLAVAKSDADAALARLDAFLRFAPYGIAFFDPDLRLIRVNVTYARANGIPPDARAGRVLTDVLPDFPTDLLADYRRVLDTGAEVRDRLVYGPAVIWEMTAFPIPFADGRRGLGVVGVDVTQRHLADRRLQESEARFRHLTESMPQVVWVARADGYREYYNARWYEYTGLTPDESLGRDGWEVVLHPDDAANGRAAWARAVETGGVYEAEYRFRRHDGEYQWFLGRAVPVRDDAGQVVRWLGTCTAIDAQKRQEIELLEAASQLRQLTEGLPLLVWACRPTGECDYLSRQWVEYTGRPMAEQLGLSWLDALHPDDRIRTAAAWEAAVEGRAEYDLEYRLRRHDGAFRWFAVRGIPLRDQAGRIGRWFGSCTDIDDRKNQAVTLERMVAERTAALHRANAELREQRIFLDAILDNVAEGIVACDAGGELKLFNAATRRMHGLPPEPLPPERWAEHYGLYEADGVTPMPPDRVPLARALAGEAVRDAEMMIRANGQPARYVLCTGVRLTAAGGMPFGAVVSMRDVTERREYERQLLVTSAALQASNEELEKFAYVASHDLQEPLRKIQAFGTRLAQKSRDLLGDQGKDYIDRMLDSAGRMRRLIEDLLQFSRVTTKPLPLATVDLNAVVRDVLQDLEFQVQRSGGAVEVGPLPTVPGDASQLRQVFQNLIGNALKFARPGIPPVVRVTAVPFPDVPPDADPPPPTGPGWRIAIADNGIGFEQGYAERIFELFQRLHARSSYEGTGLGLAIARKIILRHGANVVARGRPNEGAAFVIDWPTRTAARNE